MSDEAGTATAVPVTGDSVASEPRSNGGEDLAARLASTEAETKKWQDMARKWETRSKANYDQVQKHEAALKLLAEKAGITIDGAPDPAYLASQLSEARSQAQESVLELAVYRAASAAGVQADTLLDSRSFMGKVMNLDPTSPEFTDQLAELAKSSAPRHPASPQPEPQTPPFPRSSGANFSGAPGESRQWTEEDVTRATPEELSAAIKKGLLQGIGVGRGKSRYNYR